LDFLLGRPEVDPGRIGVMGFSMGGVTAIRAAARHAQIAAIVAEGGYFNLGKHLAGNGATESIPMRALRYSIAAAYWLQVGENPWQVSPIDDLPAISPRAVLLIYGEGEIFNGLGDLQFSAAGEPKEL
jgi:dienelactone hydrolase